MHNFIFLQPNSVKMHKFRCSRKKHALGKFDAKAFFEAWGTASDVVFREESEFQVKNGPKLLRKQDFCKIRKNLKIRNFVFFENFLKSRHQGIFLDDFLWDFFQFVWGIFFRGQNPNFDQFFEKKMKILNFLKIS